MLLIIFRLLFNILGDLRRATVPVRLCADGKVAVVVG